MRQDYWWCDQAFEHLRHAYSALKHLEQYLCGEQPTKGVESYLKRIREFCRDIIHEIDNLIGDKNERI